MSHEFVSDIDRVHVLRGYRRVIWQDLARAKQFAKALLDVASYFFAPRSALHASGVDDARPNHLGDHPKAAIGYHFKTGHRETA